MASLKKRGKIFYARFYVGGRRRVRSLQTAERNVAKQKLRELESGLARGDDNPLPGRTPVAQIVDAYVRHIRAVKTAKSAQTDVYYLREVFGPICDGLRITSRRVSARCRKRPLAEASDRRFKPGRIEVPIIEHITTADVSEFVAAQVRSRGLAPKTGNRYREIICRLFNWAIQQQGLRMPGIVQQALSTMRPALRRAAVYVMEHGDDVRDEHAAADLGMTPKSFRGNKSRAFAELRRVIPGLIRKSGIMLSRGAEDAIFFDRHDLGLRDDADTS